MQPVCRRMIFLLFTPLYLIIQLKINVLILLKEPSREKALLTLHVMTEMHFLLQKSKLGFKDQESIQSSTTLDLIERAFPREGSPFLACNDRNAFFTSEK